MDLQVLIPSTSLQFGKVFYCLEVTSRRTGSTWNIEKRFREFVSFRHNLKEEYPSIPPLPPKTLMRTSQPEYIRYRQDQLHVFFATIVSRKELCLSQLFLSFVEYEEHMQGVEVPKVHEVGSENIGKAITDAYLSPSLFLSTLYEPSPLTRFDSYLSSLKFLHKKRSFVGVTELRRFENGVFALQWSANHDSVPVSLAYNDQSGLILVAFNNGRIHGYSLDSDQPCFQIHPHKGSIRGVVFTMEFREIVSIGEDKRLVVTDVSSHMEICSTVVVDKPVNMKTWEKRLIVMFAHKMSEFECRNKELMLTFAYPEQPFTLSCLHINSHFAFIGTQAGVVLLYRLDTHEECMVLQGVSAITAIVACISRGEVMVGNDKGFVTVFNLRDAEIRHVCRGDESRVTYLGWEENSQVMVVAGVERKLRVMRLPSTWEMTVPAGVSNPSTGSLSGWYDSSPQS